MINNILILIKKIIGGKYATLLGDFGIFKNLESSKNFNNQQFLKNQFCWLYRLQTAVAQSFFLSDSNKSSIILKVY